MKVKTIITAILMILSLSACLNRQALNLPGNTNEIPDGKESSLADDPQTDSKENVTTNESPEEDSIPEKGETDIEVPDLKEKLKEESKVNDEEIKFFHQDDFDNDGKEEAFAITGIVADYDTGDDSPEIIEGVIWFVNGDTCTKLRESEAWGFIRSDRVMKFGSRNYIMFDEVATTAYITFVWIVSEGKVEEAEISMKGEVIQEHDNESFSILDSSYDFLKDADGNILGHTWKKYDFYYDDVNDKIQEYGGTEIDTETADSLYGKPFAKELLLPGDKQTELLYFGNGMVVLNFERPDGEEIQYYHYIYDMNKGSFMDDFGGETTAEEPLCGTYLKALCPDMASYKMPVSDN